MAKKTVEIEAYCEATGALVTFQDVDISDNGRGFRLIGTEEDEGRHLLLEQDRYGVRHCHVDCINADLVRNMRSFPTEGEDWESHVGSIKEHGVLQPILVEPTFAYLPARYDLCAGFRRYFGAREAGLEQIPIIILPEGVDRDAIQLVENISRKDPDPIETGLLLRKMQAKGKQVKNKKTGKSVRRKLSEDDLASLTGLSHAKVHDYMAIAENGHKKAVEAYRDGELPVSMLRVLVSLPRDEQPKHLEPAKTFTAQAFRDHIRDTKKALAAKAKESRKPAPEPKGGDRRKVTRGGKKFIVRPAVLLVEDLSFYEKELRRVLDENPDDVPVVRARVQTLQYALGQIDGIEDDPIPESVPSGESKTKDDPKPAKDTEKPKAKKTPAKKPAKAKTEKTKKTPVKKSAKKPAKKRSSKKTTKKATPAE